MTLCVETLCLVREGFGNYAGMTPSEAKGNGVIYYYLLSDYQVWLVTIYNKDEMIDLCAEEKRTLKRMLQAELAARRKSQ